MVDEQLGGTRGRQSGPLCFRLILQPIVAAALAIRKGRRDRKGKQAFFVALLRQPDRRRTLLKEASVDIGMLFLVTGMLDIIYQLIVFHTIRPGQSLIAATVLALLPYVVVRGMTDRIAKSLQRKTSDKTPSLPVE